MSRRVTVTETCASQSDSKVRWRDARTLIRLFPMPESTKAAIAVPSKDPKKKEKDEKDGVASKKKPDEKEGEELVRSV